jgi:hypothetical protein
MDAANGNPSGILAIIVKRTIFIRDLIKLRMKLHPKFNLNTVNF